MEPIALVTKHSEIIDAKVNLQRQLFLSVQADVAAYTARIVDQMIVDDKGICKDCKENKVLLQKALTYVRVAMNKQRPIINQIYGDGIAQIDMLVNDYITWMRHG